MIRKNIYLFLSRFTKGYFRDKRFYVSGILLVCISFLSLSCEKFVYNIYETERHEKDIHVTTDHNIDQLLALPLRDTLHVVFFGDSQRFYDDLEDLVESVNQLPQLDAVIITGDLTDFGLSMEYDLSNEVLSKLNVPFLTVIGNHDCLENGVELYESIYGPLNYSFTWNKIRFIMLNTNSREFNFNGSVPDLNWMHSQLLDTADYEACLFISHVPPYHRDFDKKLEQDFIQTVREAKNTVLSANGHNHTTFTTQFYNDGIWYLNTGSPSNRIYNYVTIYPFSSSSKKFDNTLMYF